jgi:hypothetical protein
MFAQFYRRSAMVKHIAYFSSAEKIAKNYVLEYGKFG